MNSTGVTGLFSGLAAITMLFSALLSAYVARRGVSDDWTGLTIPGLLCLSIIPSAAVSFLLRAMRGRLIAAGAALLFTGIHLASWRGLAHAGTPSADFVSVISGMVGVAAAGGTIAVIAATERVYLVAWYWHYLNLLCIVTAVVLTVWR
jgi:cytochrome c oxidase subunit III